MSSKASLRNLSNQLERQKDPKKRKQSIRVLMYPRKKYTRIDFIPIRVNLRDGTVFKIFESHAKYLRSKHEAMTKDMLKYMRTGIFGIGLIEMTVLKEDADKRMQDVLDIIFELEGKRRDAELM